MKTKIVPLSGDIHENLYQLGLSEKDSFLKLEARVLSLLSTSILLRQGQDILSRARMKLKKKKEIEETFFESCIRSYAEGLGSDLSSYLSFLSLFEIAAHYGQAFPELKSILPGCTSLYTFEGGEVTHTRLIDYPLVGHFDMTPRLYLWRPEGKPTILSYSCEGLAPLFFQVVHESGLTLALHHKPGREFFREGTGIFQITFDLLMECRSAADIKRELKKKTTFTKWGLFILDKGGKVDVYDVEGPTLSQESYKLSESGPLIFTNIPLKHEEGESSNHLNFCYQRQSWLKQKLAKKSNSHLLDLVTDIQDQKETKWLHPAATLSTTGAISINLTRGILDVKEGEAALVGSDAIMRFSLADQRSGELLKPQSKASDFEKAWKHASLAQGHFDSGHLDIAYHHLQMAEGLVPNKIWKDIFRFYLCLWDFKFVMNNKELSHVYKKLRKLSLPAPLADQAKFLCMRLEKKLGLQISISKEELAPEVQEGFEQELKANRALFATWMKLLYPRMEILDVFSPHLK